MRGVPGALAALLLCACSGLRPGLGEKGPVLEVALEPAAGEERAAAVAAAQRRALDQALGLFISSSARSSSGTVLEEKILGSPRAYIRRYKLLPASGRSAPRLLAQVALDWLLKDLDALGLVQPEGVYGTPRLLVSLKETGPGAGREVGRASDALRRGLSLKGYDVQDLSDRIAGDRQKTGSLEEAAAAAKAAAAQVFVSGVASVQPAADERYAGLKAMRARVAARAAWTASRGPLAEAQTEATAVDLAGESAAAQALENAGLLAADKLAAAFAGSFRERSVIGVSAEGFSELPRVVAFLDALRALPGVAGAATAALRPEAALLRVFVEGLSAEDLAVRLLGMRGFSLEVRAVEADQGLVDVEVMRGGGTKQDPRTYDR
ncbi:MAG: hypothetical protein HY922_15135 [Elusimicrobia bacterium]|nr:hypothetical protein [Elusimicrobiota bacterium]